MSGNPSGDGFITSQSWQATDLSKIQELIASLIGDPRLSNFLSDAIQKAVGPMFSSSVGMYGGAAMPYGSTALFGPRDAGMEFMTWAQDQSVSAAMAASNQAIADLKQQQTINYLMAFGGAANADQALAMSQRFTFTGMASNFMFNQLQPAALQRGLEEGSRYLGAGGIGFDSTTLQNQEDASRMSAALSSDFISNPGQYYGLKGADVGRLYAEMGRTGQLGRIRNENEGMLGPGGMESAIISATREASRSVQAFRQIFRGSVTDVLDQVNALMGMDVMATFDDQGRSLLQGMSAAGSLVGFAPQQMAALGGMSKVISQRAGMDSWGAGASAIYGAQLIGTMRQGGHVSSLVNPVNFRNDVMMRVTGAQQSGLARDISGAYALLQQRDPAAAEAFLEEVRAMDPDTAMGLDPSTIAGMVGGGVTGFDIRDASFTKEAEMARAKGVGLRVAARHNAASIQASRLGMLERQIEGIAGVDVAGVMAALDGGPVTEDRIRAALMANGMSSDAAGSTTGAMMRRYELQAEALGFTGGARGVDQFLASTYDVDRTRQIIEQTGGSVRMLEMLGGKNVAGGLMGLNEYIRQLGETGGDANIRGFVQAALGGAGKDMSAKEALDLFGVGSGNLQDYLDSTVTDPKGLARQQQARIGADIALQVLFTKTYKGQAATKEQIAKARSLIEGFSGDPSDLMGYAQDMSGGGFDMSTAMNIQEMEELLKEGVGFESNEELQKSAMAMTVMEQVIAEDMYKSRGLRGKDNKDAALFRSTTEALKKAYEESISSTKTGKVRSFEEFKKSWSGWKDADTMDRTKYNELLEAEKRANEEIGAPGSTATGLGAILDVLKRMLEFFEEGGLGNRTGDATEGKNP